MKLDQKSSLEIELSELYDIRLRKNKRQKLLNQEAYEAKKDMKLLTIMFGDEPSDITVLMDPTEKLMWNAKEKRLIYFVNNEPQFLEGANYDVLLKIRPFLNHLVKKAKEFYLDN